MLEIEPKAINLNLRPDSVEEEVKENISYILSSIESQNPLTREMGIDSIVDSKGNSDRKYETKIINLIEKYEPRFIVKEVVREYVNHGKWNLRVRGRLVED